MRVWGERSRRQESDEKHAGYATTQPGVGRFQSTCIDEAQRETGDDNGTQRNKKRRVRVSCMRAYERVMQSLAVVGGDWGGFGLMEPMLVGRWEGEGSGCCGGIDAKNMQSVVTVIQEGSER